MAHELIDVINPLGRPPKYKKPEQLWEKFLQYTDFVRSNPIPIATKMRSTKRNKDDEDNKGTASREIEQAPRPFTLVGFQLYAGITNWAHFKKQERNKKEDFVIVIRAIEQCIEEHQISGAAVGVYNSNLVARLNGISEKTEVDVEASKNMILASVSNEELIKMYNETK